MTGASHHPHRHPQSDHHVCIEQSMFGPVSIDACLCGAAPSDPLHSAPPCEWCEAGSETTEPTNPFEIYVNGERMTVMGAPAPWWHRAWCRLVTWLYADKGKK